MIKKIADNLFRWYCHPDYYPDIKGDLEELYHDKIKINPGTAEIQYFLEVAKLFRPALIKPFIQNSKFNNSGMYKNYIKSGFRNLAKQKVFSVINIVGLAIGLAAFLMINQYVVFEKSYDKFFKDSDLLYRLTTDQVVDGVIKTRDAMSFAPSGKALVETIPELENSTVTFKFNELILRKQDKSITEKRVLAVDSSYLKIFDYNILSGDPNTMLSEPNTIVLTESKAKFHFGEINPLGKSIMVLSGLDREFKVTGVIQDTPENTHYKFDILISIATFKEDLEGDAWSSFNYYTFLKLAPNVDIENVRQKLPLISNFNEDIRSLEFNLQKVEDIHLHSDFTYEPEVHGSSNAVTFLSFISTLILIIAWVNYINLSTAKAIDRAKEVGVRKSIGAHKPQLMLQFLFESVMLNIFAAVLAMGLIEIFYPGFNQLVGKAVIDSTWENQDILIKLFGFAIVGALVSGLYPAFVLSSFKTVVVLKGKFRNSAKGTWLRKGLVVIQFTVSLMLLAATFIINRQVNYMQAADKGIDMDYVVGMSRPRYTNQSQEVMVEKFKQFKHELLSHHAIENVGFTNSMPGGGSSDISSTVGEIQILGKTDKVVGTTYLQRCDDRYLDAVGIHLIAGRRFDETMASDSAAIIVNESYLSRLGINDYESVLNETIQYGNDDSNHKYRLIGVMQDYHRTSLKNIVEPTALFYSDYSRRLVVRLRPDSYQDGLSHLEETYAQFFPTTPFSYIFLDERFQALFQEDHQFGTVIGTFSIFAVIVASLGLFGLSAFMAINRAKEVGIRKVLGATVPQILGIFYKEFLFLIAISTIVGVPLVYYTMNNWLNNYAYRVDFPWLFVGIALLLVLASALLTVGYQTIRVAAKNPSETLRYE